jgi:hypothetical protein
MERVTLQDIFQAAFPASEQTHPLPWHVCQAGRAIMRCRTAVLGGHVQSCPDGHISRAWYNACKHRSCPQCAFVQIERWLEKQKARLLDGDHSHVIFTIPHDLNPLWLANVPLMTSLLFASVRDTLFELLGAPKYLGARPGFIAGLHTWGQTLVLHPHIHCLVTGGGLTPAGHWMAGHNGYLLPGRVVMAVFRGKLLDALRRAWGRGALALPAAMRPQPFLNLLNRLGHTKKTRWNVRIMARYPYGQGVATSLARSMRGGPLKNARLVSFDRREVTFRYHDNHDTPAGGNGRVKPMRLPLAAFIRRVLLHVPVLHSQVVRCYGLYHHSQAAGLARCRAVLGQRAVEAPVKLDWQTSCAHRGEAHPERCPRCGQLLVCSAIIPRGGAPPSGRCGVCLTSQVQLNLNIMC